jgi:Domain of unknown function (DUF6398)/Plasmid pRiA4b ORF-3-like protein
MAKTSKSETVPKALQAKFDSITAITDAFAKQHLNDEYAQMIRFATAALCRKRPSPLASGKDKTWACGITHAIGMVNFLFDSSQDPHVSAKEIYQWFEVSPSTGQAKSKQVRDVLDMHQMDPDWCLPSKLDNNPMAWLISLNGLIVDVRSAPRAVQELAHAKGLIPYIPGGDREPVGLASTSKPSKQAPPAATEALLNSLYVLDVQLINGPMTEKFIAKNPVVSRRIEIKGSQTLQDLHAILFKAFNRQEEHLYEFQVGGIGPNDPAARCYGLESGGDPSYTGDVANTRIADLGLAFEEVFGYWFDFGDDWWHQINVVEIKDTIPPGKYPKITNRLGASPPQYADFD